MKVTVGLFNANLMNYHEWQSLCTERQIPVQVVIYLQKRHVLEENNELEPRTSGLDDDLEELEEEEMDGEEEAEEEEGEYRVSGREQMEKEEK